jgi:outer membrane protein assembly factor BamD (BamD/ComL family)
MKKGFQYFICIYFLLFTVSCASRKLISDDKWVTKHTIQIKCNQEDIVITNNAGENVSYERRGSGVYVQIPKLRPRNLNLIISHPDRIDAELKIGRSIRAGAFIADITLGATLYCIPLMVDFANANIYQIKKTHRSHTIYLNYNDAFYLRKFNEAEYEGQISSYEKFIKNYPESKYTKTARNKMHNLAWQNAERLDNISAYEKFINNYPDAEKVKDAQKQIYELAFNKVVEKNTAQAYENYVNQYPNSPKANEAKTRARTIKEVDDAYAACLKTDSYDEFSKFLNKYKKTKYNKEIAIKMASAFYKENTNNVKTLDGVNGTIASLKKIEGDYDIKCEELNRLYVNRDQLLAEKLKAVANKNQFLTLLNEQVKTETGDFNENLAFSIAVRVISNTKIYLDGQYSLWRSDGIKEVFEFQNNKKSGLYTKYSADEKTILEKGNLDNGLKTGLYVINYPSGKKQFEQKWNFGTMESQVEFDEQGISMTEKKLKEDKQKEEEKLKAAKQKKEERKMNVAKLKNSGKLIFTNIKSQKCGWCSDKFVDCSKKSTEELEREADLLVNGYDEDNPFSFFAAFAAAFSGSSKDDIIYINNYSCPQYCSLKCQSAYENYRRSSK